MSRARLFTGVGLGLAILLACGAGPAVGASRPTPVTISPAAGTPDASPGTQISILGPARRQIKSVAVMGSVSGHHGGRLATYSANRGASFVPAKPFAQGERVSVVVHVAGRGAIRLSFSIATLGITQPLLNLPQRQPDKLQHFATRPDLLAPKIALHKRAGKLPGDIFLTPLPSPIVHPESNNAISISPVGPGGPMILDSGGNVVWFRPLPRPDVAADLRIQRYRGRSVLTWWQGGVTPSAFGLGEGVIADHSYRTVATVHSGNGYPMDLHEFTLTPSGDALFTVYSPIRVHVKGSPAGTTSPLLDSIVQEVDTRTGLVVWEWHSYGHIPLQDSYATPQNSSTYDAYHINSIQLLAGGRILVSARDTCALYEIDQTTGRIVWTLGGKASSFKLGHGARFYFQHDAQLLPGDRITMFDDEAGPPQKAPRSRGLVLALDIRRHRATVVRQYSRPGNTSAQSEGSLQLLPSGNVFVGFGSEPFFSEFTAAGQLLFDGSLPQDDGTYRTYRFDWSATPRTRPDVVAGRDGGSRTRVDVSWNGATAVARWQVLGGSSASSLEPLATSAKRGFETQIELSSTPGVVAVRALDSNGRALVRSAAVTVR